MLNFTFEETQLIGNLIIGAAKQAVVNKDFIINRLVNAISNTEDKELVSIGEITLNKLRCMDNDALKEFIDTFQINNDE